MCEKPVTSRSVLRVIYLDSGLAVRSWVGRSKARTWYGWRKRDRRYIPFPSLEELSGKKEFT